MTNEIPLSPLISSLKYALTQVHNDIEKKLVAYEFWHSLNRKHLVKNNEVQPLINETLRGLLPESNVIE